MCYCTWKKSYRQQKTAFFCCKKDCFVVYPGRIELPIES